MRGRFDVFGSNLPGKVPRRRHRNGFLSLNLKIIRIDMLVTLHQIFWKNSPTNLQLESRAPVVPQIGLRSHKDHRATQLGHFRGPLGRQRSERFRLHDGETQQKHVGSGVAQLPQGIQRVLAGGVAQGHTDRSPIHADVH